MMTDAVAGLISQGGFAVLAAFMGLICYKIYQMSDKVLNRALDVIERAAGAQAALAASIGTLSGEFAGLRTGVHGIRDSMTAYETRQYEIDRRLDALEAKRRTA